MKNITIKLFKNLSFIQKIGPIVEYKLKTFLKLNCLLVKQGNQHYSLTEHVDKEAISNEKQSLKQI